MDALSVLAIVGIIFFVLSVVVLGAVAVWRFARAVPSVLALFRPVRRSEERDRESQ
jgi:uncharacterized membrane protein